MVGKVGVIFGDKLLATFTTISSVAVQPFFVTVTEYVVVVAGAIFLTALGEPPSHKY